MYTQANLQAMECIQLKSMLRPNGYLIKQFFCCCQHVFPWNFQCEPYGLVIDKAIDSMGDVKSVRGAQLREFSQYLLEVDSRKIFDSLCRVCDYTNGNAIWVSETSKGALLEPLTLKKQGLLQMKNDLQRRIYSWSDIILFWS
jgi:hypothetical protein